MYVAVTGGTGFVGSHATKALLEAGHRVRLLVRSPDKVGPTLAPLGIDAGAADLDLVVADVTDRSAIEKGLEGVDAVVHAASVYTLDPARAEEVATTNDNGIRNVLESAVAAGLDPIVHVSSVVALLRDDLAGDTLTADSPPGNSPVTYPASKARQEAYARGLQDAGHPVVIVHPGGVWGPNDPYDGESLALARAMVKGLYRMVPSMTIPIVDVRDVAIVITAAMEAGLGPRRFMAGGSAVSGPEIVSLVTTAQGRPRKATVVPAWMAAPAGPIGDFLRARGIETGIGGEGVWIATRRAKVDNTQTESALDMRFRPLKETVADQVSWMIADGRMRPPK